MLNAMAKSTPMPQIPDFPDVTQALSGHFTDTLLHAGSARDTIDDDIWTNSHPPPLVAPPTASAVLDRPPAAPDPVTDAFCLQLLTPMTAPLCSLANLLMELFKPSLPLPLCLRPMPPMNCTHHSEVMLSHLPDGAVQPVTLSMSTIVTQPHCAMEYSTPHLCLHWPSNKEPRDPYPCDHICEVAKDTSEGDILWDTLNLGEYPSGFDKCTFDLSVEPLPTSTGFRNDGSTMALPSRDLFPTNSSVLLINSGASYEKFWRFQLDCTKDRVLERVSRSPEDY